MCKSEKKKFCYSFIFVFSMAAFVLSAALKLYFANSITVKNIELKNLSDQKTELEKEIYKLSFIDSQLSNLSAVENRAHELGFTEMTENVDALNLSELNHVASLSR